MLMRRTRAYSSSCPQIILVYLHPFLAIHTSAAKNRKKSQKAPIFGVQGHSRSLMLTFLRRSSQVLVMIISMSVPICNHLHA